MAKFKESLDIKTDALREGGAGLEKIQSNQPLDQERVSAPKPFANLEKNTSGVLELRTFEGDIAAHIKEQQVSKAQIAAAEANKRQREREKKRREGDVEGPSRSGSMVVILLLLVVLAGAYWWFFMGGVLPSNDRATPEPLLTHERDTFLESDAEQVIRLPFLAKNDIEEAYNNLSGREGITELVFETVSFDEEGEEQIEAVSPQRIIETLSWSNAEMFTVAIGERAAFGRIERGGQGGSFMIFEVANKDLAMAQLLQWERMMTRDVYGILHYNSRLLSASTFTGEVVGAFDVRALEAEEESISYAVTEDYIFIASDTSTLEALLKHEYLLNSKASASQENFE